MPVRVSNLNTLTANHATGAPECLLPKSSQNAAGIDIIAIWNRH